MSTLDEREKGFERKFASDAEKEFRATARRNRMLGEWAAHLMGLKNVEDYARAVVRSELDQPGDEDVLRKVSRDLSGAGLAVGEGEVRKKMDEFLAQARSVVHAGE
ncbi:MAG: DUF1476 domain-containing protein, partial [Acidimicrobiales bacterium]